MVSLRRRFAARALALGVGYALLALLTASCVGESAATAGPISSPESTAGAKPLPAPVSVRADPQGGPPADSTFVALPHARAEFGRLGGAAYQIEMPDHWNGELVLYMHGFQSLAASASVEPPAIRAYLIRNGYAWGASSFSSTALIPGRAADETAALWDRFARTYGRPVRSYVMGESMGGAATFIAAERYADRFDGALGLCGYAGQSAESQIVGDYFVAGAYVAGITQADFDAQPDVTKLINERIRPALTTPANERAFEDILVALTGGPRPFDRAGLRAEDATNWLRAAILVGAGIAYNSDRTYVLPAALGATAAAFDRAAVRIAPDLARVSAFNDGNVTTGKLEMPLLTLHTTGDWQVPVDQEQTLLKQVDAAGRSDLLVQRLIQAAPHCGFTLGEWEQGFADLVDWVATGNKPAGDDLHTADLREAGARFTLAPRFGSAASATLPGADQRLLVHGSITLDGEPLVGGFFRVEVNRDGLRQVCSITADGINAGQFESVVASERELAGCGGPGSLVALDVYAGGRLFVSPEVPWPVSGHDITLDASFARTDAAPARVTVLSGGALDASGNPLPPGTRVDAYIGGVLCGVSSLPHGLMQAASPDAYEILIAGPESRAGCAEDGTISFRLNGAPVAVTATNGLHPEQVSLDLTLAP
ncbi:MAG TPA: hypothetical protein VEZ14_03280 [Dehalococcoidia bacterium]|nr:hypothetical protein [Dehalococcoidia bacterium]